MTLASAWKVIAVPPPVLTALAQPTGIFVSADEQMPEDSANPLDARLSAHLRESRELVATGRLREAAEEHDEYFGSLRLSIDTDASSALLARFAHRPAHAIELLISAGLLQEFAGERARYPMLFSVEASQRMFDGLARTISLLPAESAALAYRPLVELARAYASIRAVGLGSAEPTELTAEVEDRLVEAQLAAAQMPRISSTSYEKISFLTDLMSLELFLHDAVRRPDEGRVSLVREHLGEVAAKHRAHPPRAELVARESARAALALAAMGAWDAALAIALDLKRSDPYGRTEAALEVLNPEAYARYGEVPPLLPGEGPAEQGAHPAARGPKLFAAVLGGTIVGEGQELDRENMGSLQRALAASKTPIVYLTEGSLYGAWAAVLGSALPLPSYVVTDSGRRVFCDDAGEWRESRAWSERARVGATAADALRFIARRADVELDDVVFAGDSVRDLAIFTSGVHALDVSPGHAVAGILAGLSRLGYLR
jgi:hypothetical protein